MFNLFMKIDVVSYEHENLSFDDFMLYAVHIDSLKEGYFRLQVACPVWLQEKHAEVMRELIYRQRAEKERKLKQLKARRETLLPADVKLKTTEEEIAELEKELAVS